MTLLHVLAGIAATFFLFVAWDERRLRRNRRCPEERQRETEARIAARRNP